MVFRSTVSRKLFQLARFILPRASRQLEGNSGRQIVVQWGTLLSEVLCASFSSITALRLQQQSTTPELLTWRLFRGPRRRGRTLAMHKRGRVCRHSATLRRSEESKTLPSRRIQPVNTRLHPTTDEWTMAIHFSLSWSVWGTPNCVLATGEPNSLGRT